MVRVIISEIENWIRNDLHFNWVEDDPTYKEILFNIAEGKYKNEDEIKSVSNVVTFINKAFTFMRYYDNNFIVNMYEKFFEIVKFYPTDLIHDWEYIFTNPDIDKFYWFLRETGSDIAIKPSKGMLQRNRKFYVLEKTDTSNSFRFKISEIKVEDLIKEFGY